MNFFVRAVVTGFAFSLGAALFRQVGKRVGLVDNDKPQQNPATNPAGENASPSEQNLQPSFS